MVSRISGVIGPWGCGVEVGGGVFVGDGCGVGVGSGTSAAHPVVNRIKLNTMENPSGLIPAPVWVGLQDYRSGDGSLHPSLEGSLPVPMQIEGM